MRRNEKGVSYAAVLFMVAVVATLSVRAIENTATRERRDKEDQLLYAGTAYMNAIRDYYENSPGTIKDYPPSMDALLEDNRTSTLRRHLRRLYADPMTGSNQWALIYTADGKIMGVQSTSNQEPIKKAGFPAALQQFTGAMHYSDWKFTYQPH